MRNLVVTVFLIALMQWHHKSKGYYELVEELGCQDTEFRLQCGRLDAKIAIIEAIFSSNDSAFRPLRSSCSNDHDSMHKDYWRIYRKNDSENFFSAAMKSDFGNFEVNFRHAINKRCSGVNYCSFVLKEDYAPASKWGSGIVYLQYICMDDVHITRSCTAELDVDFEGFVQSPGYPRFYIGERTCLWTLKARESQTVRVKFLDISLRGIMPFEQTCLDWLVVSENGFKKLTTCGDSVGNTEIQSSGSVLNVSLIATSKLLYPKRGLLFHYKAIGCLMPKTPLNGMVIFRNDSNAQFRCFSGYVFPDTLSRDKIITCYNENTWDSDVSDCISSTLNKTDFNSAEKVNFSAVKAAIMEANTVEDVVIPSIIMAVLFIGNAVVLLLILHYRKKFDLSQCRRAPETTEDHELKNYASQE